MSFCISVNPSCKTWSMLRPWPCLMPITLTDICTKNTAGSYKSNFSIWLYTLHRSFVSVKVRGGFRDSCSYFVEDSWKVCVSLSAMTVFPHGYHIVCTWVCILTWWKVHCFCSWVCAFVCVHASVALRTDQSRSRSLRSFQAASYFVSNLKGEAGSGRMHRCTFRISRLWTQPIAEEPKSQHLSLRL